MGQPSKFQTKDCFQVLQEDSVAQILHHVHISISRAIQQEEIFILIPDKAVKTDGLPMHTNLSVRKTCVLCPIKSYLGISAYDQPILP